MKPSPKMSIPKSLTSMNILHEYYMNILADKRDFADIIQVMSFLIGKLSSFLNYLVG